MYFKQLEQFTGQRVLVEPNAYHSHAGYEANGVAFIATVELVVHTQDGNAVVTLLLEDGTTQTWTGYGLRSVHYPVPVRAPEKEVAHVH